MTQNYQQNICTTTSKFCITLLDDSKKEALPDDKGQIQEKIAT